jgi:hypothetical protein
LAASAAIAAIVVLDGAIRHRSVARAALGGLLLAVAENFRSEYVLFPIGCLLVALLERALRKQRVLSVRELAVAAAVALCCQLPWAVHYHRATGAWSMMESSRGNVAFSSLGALPGNPWGIVPDDSFAQAIVERAGCNCDATSHEGGIILGKMFREAVAQHPLAYGEKLATNGLKMLVGGFETGNYGVRGAESNELDVIKEKIKLFLHFNPNLSEIAAYKSEGVWDRPPAPFYVALMIAIVITRLAFALVLAGSLAALGLVAARRLELRWEPIVVLGTCALLYRCAVVVVCYYTPLYMNDTYLFCVPLFAALVGTSVAAIKRIRTHAA